MKRTMTLTVDLTASEALALAQFVKRVGHSDFKVNAVDDQEAYLMADAFNEIRKALEEEGYAPR